MVTNCGDAKIQVANFNEFSDFINQMKQFELVGEMTIINDMQREKSCELV